jgi:hypothetical protein
LQRSIGITLSIMAILLGVSAHLAVAQSPPPFGFWATNSGETLLVSASQCSLALNGKITTSGSCSWNATYAGGILTIMSNQLYRPAPVYFNVIWVNQQTITVNGDTFSRRQ